MLLRCCCRYGKSNRPIPLYFIKGQAGFILRKKKQATDVSLKDDYQLPLEVQASYLIGDLHLQTKVEKEKGKKGKKGRR